MPAASSTLFDELERRLSVILALDVAGYSRLMAEDEAGTFRRVRDKLSHIIGPLLDRDGGRLFKNTGDGALVEFPAATPAVSCAISIQRENEAFETEVPVEWRIRLRIGISFADVIVQDGDLFGEGVNLAARLEGVATIGGIAVSEAVAHEAADTGAVFLDVGLVPLKNIARPPRVYRVALGNEPTGATSARAPGGAMVRGFGERPAVTVLPLRAEPGGDDVLADGMTEDLIGALSRWRTFPVISRNSVFAFKGRALELPFIAAQLGARFVVQGLIRRRDATLRIALELHDVETMDLLLGETYDFDLNDATSAEDEIVRAVVGALEPELLRRERDRAARKPERSATAYECLQRGHWHHYRYTPDDSRQARALFRQALEIDPNYAQAAAALALTLSHAAYARWEVDEAATRREALAAAQLAVQADARDPQSHFALGYCLNHLRATDEAIERFRETVRLNPSHAAGHANLAFGYNYRNEPDRALPAIELALRLSPHDPRRFLWLPALAGARYLGGDYRGALRAGQEALIINAAYLPVTRYIVAAMGQLGQLEAAQAILPLLRRLDADRAAVESHLNGYFAPAAIRHILTGLERAGFD